MSGRADVWQASGGWKSGVVRGLPFERLTFFQSCMCIVTFFFQCVYVTLFLQWIAFLFGRDEEEEQ